MTEKPIKKKITPIFELSFFVITGHSSRMTAYIIAPAAKPRRYGSKGKTRASEKRVINAAIGSITPDKNP